MSHLSPLKTMEIVVVVQERSDAQVIDKDVCGMKEGQAADIEPPADVPRPSRPDTRVKQVLMPDLSPEDRTIYTTGDSLVKPKVMKVRSSERKRVFPPKYEGKQFRDYRDYYTEAPGKNLILAKFKVAWQSPR